MQFMIINVPAGEQVASLSHSLNADELLIGQSESCQIRLPDRQNQVAEQHVRLTREGPLWYVENLSDHPLHLNQAEVPVRARQRLLLSDGDILSCGGYQLVASDFTPWLGTTDRTDKPELTAPEDQDPEQYALAPTNDGEEDEEALDDPFAREPASANNQSDIGNVDVAMSVDKPLAELASTSNRSHTIEYSITRPENHTPLIDILSESNELDDDWSIHRGLWYGKITQPQASFYSPLTDSTPRTQTKQQRSICKAMLTALDQAIEDFCPDHLSEQFRQSITSISPVKGTRRTVRMRQYFPWQTDTPPPDVASSMESMDFLPRYQRYYQQLMDSKHYRLLFLQRFRQALKEQEQLFGSNDDGT